MCKIFAPTSTRITTSCGMAVPGAARSLVRILTIFCGLQKQIPKPNNDFLAQQKLLGLVLKTWYKFCTSIPWHKIEVPE
jgi:hypothetical protein